MRKKEFNWTSFDGLNMFARSWDYLEEPDAVICLVHGMGEHSGRYDNLGKFFPAFVQKTGLNTDHLSKNPTVGENYNKDPLVHDKISVSMYLGILNAGNEIMKRTNLNIPCLLFHGTDDEITSWKASEEFASENKKNVELKLWDGQYHELHNEDNRGKIMEYVYSWLKNRML